MVVCPLAPVLMINPACSNQYSFSCTHGTGRGTGYHITDHTNPRLVVGNCARFGMTDASPDGLTPNQAAKVAAY